MIVYSIRDIENLCGIKAHTLRVWEKRYGLLEPKRTDTNIRYYDENDLKFLLNLSVLYRNGLKISKIAKMSKEEIRNRVTEVVEIDHAFENSLDTLSLAMIELDEYKFVQILNRNLEQRGFEQTMIDVIYPLLEKINLMWIAGSINEVHEAFVLNLIQNKLVVEIDKLEVKKHFDKPSFLLYLPPGESQKLSLYYMYYILRKRGFSVFFLGESIEYRKLYTAAKLMQPNYVFTIINETFVEQPLQEYIERILNDLDVCYLISGYQAIAQQLQPKERCTILEGLQEVMQFIDQLKQNK